MSLIRTPCECEDKTKCIGEITETEHMMAEMDNSRGAQEYHEVMNLFEDAFVAVQDIIDARPV